MRRHGTERHQGLPKAAAIKLLPDFEGGRLREHGPAADGRGGLRTAGPAKQKRGCVLGFRDQCFESPPGDDAEVRAGHAR